MDTDLILVAVTRPPNRLTSSSVEVLIICALVSVLSVKIVLVAVPMVNRLPPGPALNPLTVFCRVAPSVPPQGSGR